MFLPGESQGRGSLVGYSPWGHVELDMTERLTDTLNKKLFMAQECVFIFASPKFSHMQSAFSRHWNRMNELGLSGLLLGLISDIHSRKSH